MGSTGETSSPAAVGRDVLGGTATTTPKLLHVGCGGKNKSSLPPELQVYAETRLDITPESKPDILADMRDLSAIPAESFDVVYSSHNIEHVFSHEVVPTLAQWRRVLRQGGFLHLRCPDLKLVCQRVGEVGLTHTLYTSPAGPITPLDILYGHIKSVSNGHVYMAHKTGFTRETLGFALQKAGFSRVRVAEKPASYELVATAYR